MAPASAMTAATTSSISPVLTPGATAARPAAIARARTSPDARIACSSPRVLSWTRPGQAPRSPGQTPVRRGRHRRCRHARSASVTPTAASTRRWTSSTGADAVDVHHPAVVAVDQRQGLGVVDVQPARMASTVSSARPRASIRSVSTSSGAVDHHDAVDRGSRRSKQSAQPVGLRRCCGGSRPAGTRHRRRARPAGRPPSPG